MSALELKREAKVSHRIPDTDFHYRVFYYSPGMGFDAGNLVYVGRSEWRTLEEAQAEAEKWEGAHK